MSETASWLWLKIASCLSPLSEVLGNRVVGEGAGRGCREDATETVWMIQKVGPKVDPKVGPEIGQKVDPQVDSKVDQSWSQSWLQSWHSNELPNKLQS